MSRSSLELARLRSIMETLKADHTAEISIKDITYYLDADEVKRLKQMCSHYKSMNDYADVRAIQLSGEAEAYWRRAKHAMQATRLANNIGFDSRQRRKAALLCERVAELYDEVVAGTPNAAAFIEHRLDGSNWDDRWHDTIDHCFPLLKTHMAKVVDPVRCAVLSVLEEIFEPIVPLTPDAIESLESNKHQLLKLARKGR